MRVCSIPAELVGRRSRGQVADAPRAVTLHGAMAIGIADTLDQLLSNGAVCVMIRGVGSRCKVPLGRNNLAILRVAIARQTKGDRVSLAGWTMRLRRAGCTHGHLSRRPQRVDRTTRGGGPALRWFHAAHPMKLLVGGSQPRRTANPAN